jgi:hypothetical protein
MLDFGDLFLFSLNLFCFNMLKLHLLLLDFAGSDSQA